MGPHVRHVHLDSFVTDTQLVAFATHTPLLEDLLIDEGRYVTDASVRRLANDCQRLKYLVLRDSSITHRSIQALVNACHGLRILHLDGCVGLSSAIFTVLARGCPQLTELTVDAGGMKEFDVNPNIASEHLLAYVYGTAHIAALNLASLRALTKLTIRDSPPPLSQHLLITRDRSGRIAWPLLINFSLSGGCDEVSDDHAIAFIKNHPTLVSLTLDETEFSDVVLRAISLFLPMIMYVGLAFNGGITAHALRHFILDCEWLQYIHLHGTGILATEFPEASLQCVDLHSSFLPMLDHLDKDAITEIQFIGFKNDDADTFDEDDDDDDYGSSDDDDDETDDDGQWVDVDDVEEGHGPLVEQFEQLTLFGYLIEEVFARMPLTDDSDIDDDMVDEAQ
ncbi:unnamed protein product [Absidia cylindrospora]